MEIAVGRAQQHTDLPGHSALPSSVSTRLYWHRARLLLYTAVVLLRTFWLLPFTISRDRMGAIPRQTNDPGMSIRSPGCAVTVNHDPPHRLRYFPHLLSSAAKSLHRARQILAVSAALRPRAARSLCSIAAATAHAMNASLKTCPRSTAILELLAVSSFRIPLLRRHASTKTRNPQDMVGSRRGDTRVSPALCPSAFVDPIGVGAARDVVENRRTEPRRLPSSPLAASLAARCAFGPSVAVLRLELHR